MEGLYGLRFDEASPKNEVRVGTEEVDSPLQPASYGGSGRVEPNRLHREKKACV